MKDISSEFQLPFTEVFTFSTVKLLLIKMRKPLALFKLL